MNNPAPSTESQVASSSASGGSGNLGLEPVVARTSDAVRSGVGGVLKTLGEAQILYGVIYADPPWSYDNAGTQGGVGVEYQTMTDAEICALKVPAAKDCVLYMWATMPRLPLAIDVIKAWGFNYKTGACWDKLRLGIGYWFRGQHELLLVGVRGKVSPPKVEDRIRSVLRCKSGRHSAKPDQVRDHIAKVFPDVPKLEMFARRKTAGWDAFGNQVEHDLLSGGGGAELGANVIGRRTKSGAGSQNEKLRRAEAEPGTGTGNCGASIVAAGWSGETCRTKMGRGLPKSSGTPSRQPARPQQVQSMKTKPKVKTVTKAAKPRSAEGRRSLERTARPPSVDMRSPLAKARDEWLASAEGLHCDDPSILRHREHAVYLTNRLVTAFRAGANWMEGEKQKRKRSSGAHERDDEARPSKTEKL